MGEKRNACRLLVGKPEGKRPLGRPRLRWVDNFEMELREICWSDMDWILERDVGVIWTGLIWLRIGTGGGLL
jgi:hypothetical protein